MNNDIKLIEAVLDQIEDDRHMGDWGALMELLDFIPRKNLIGYLSNERQDQAVEDKIITIEEAY